MASEQAPAVCVGQNAFGDAVVEGAVAAVASDLIEAVPPRAANLSEYRASGGYEMWANCKSGKRSVEAVLKTMEDAGLHGLGVGQAAPNPIRCVIRHFAHVIS